MRFVDGPELMWIYLAMPMTQLFLLYLRVLTTRDRTMALEECVNSMGFSLTKKASILNQKLSFTLKSHYHS